MFMPPPPTLNKACACVFGYVQHISQGCDIQGERPKEWAHLLNEWWIRSWSEGSSVMASGSLNSALSLATHFVRYAKEVPGRSSSPGQSVIVVSRVGLCGHVEGA